MMPKGVPNKRYTPEFRQAVVEKMLEEKLSYAETDQICGITSHSVIPAWERIYLGEGSEGFRLERRRRSRKSRPRKALKPEAEEDLLAEVQRLRAENDCLKNLQTLVLENERHQRRKRRQFRNWGKNISWKFCAQLPRAAFYCHLKQMERTDK